jgi:uncharacterized protein (TIGR03382 family)
MAGCSASPKVPTPASPYFAVAVAVAVMRLHGSAWCGSESESDSPVHQLGMLVWEANVRVDPGNVPR